MSDTEADDSNDFDVSLSSSPSGDTDPASPGGSPSSSDDTDPDANETSNKPASGTGSSAAGTTSPNEPPASPATDSSPSPVEDDDQQPETGSNSGDNTPSEAEGASEEDVEAEETEVEGAEEDDTEELPTGFPEGFELIADCDQLNTLLDAVTPIRDEVVLKVTDDQISAVCVDPASVAMTETTIDTQAVESISNTGFKAGLNVAGLSEALGAMDSDALIRITTTDDERLQIESGALSFTRAQPATDMVSDRPSLPDFDHNIAVTTNQSFLGRARKATGILNEHITIEWDDGLSISAIGDTDTVTIEPKDDEHDVLRQRENEVGAVFSQDYISPIVRTIPNGADVTVELSKNKPIELEYTDGEIGITAYYMIAPRIDTDAA